MRIPRCVSKIKGADWPGANLASHGATSGFRVRPNTLMIRTSGITTIRMTPKKTHRSES